MKRPLLLVLCAIIFYFSGLRPGRVLLPLDILCGSLPWSATSGCAGHTAANPVTTDQVFQFYPWHSIVRAGGWRALLWNPYAFAGSPLLANGQSAMLYPPNWLHVLLPPTWSYVLLALLRTIVALLATWAFARRHMSEHAAMLAAVSYAFSYVFVFSIGYPLGDAMSILPALFWALDRPLLLAAATALELLAGQPEVAVVAFLALGIYFFSRRPSLRQTASAGAAVLGGAVLALPQLLPLLQYVSLGAASRLRSEYTGMFYSAHTLLEFLTPEFFGTSSPAHRWGSNDGGYFGLLPALLVCFWMLVGGKKSSQNPFTWIFLGSLAIIYRIPPFPWLMELPWLRTVFVTKFWISATFSGAMMAGFALDDWEANPGRRRMLSIALPAVFCVALLLARWHFRDFIDALHLGSFEWGVMGSFALVLAVSMVVMRFQPKFAAAVVFLDCLMYLGAYNTAAPVNLLYPKTGVIDFLKADPERARIIGSGVLPPNTAAVYGLEDVRGYDAITYWPYFKYMTAIDSSFPDLAARIDLTDRGLYVRDRFLRPIEEWGDGYRDYLKRVFYWNDELTRLERPALFDLLNVKYILVPHGAKPVADFPIAYAGEVDVYMNPNRLPRAFVVGAWDVVPDAESALAAIRRPGFDPRETAVLCCASRAGFQPANGTGFQPARILSYQPNEVVVEATGPGVLVLTDTNYPGWSATPGRLYTADYLFRGVVLSPGVQVVAFHFSVLESRAWRP